MKHRCDSGAEGSAMPELPSGTVTLLFTDIEGSTQLLRRLGDGYGQVLAQHHRLLRRAFAAHDGHEVDTQGDSFFVAFARPLDAVLAAAQAQESLFTHPWPEGSVVRVRMGLHTGTPVLSEDGERYLGLDVHQAARIEAAAHGGQVVLSAATARRVEDALPEGLELRSLGEHRLKDFDRPAALYQLLIDGLPASFPPLRTDQPEPESDDAGAAARLPSLVGRETELARLRERLNAARAGRGSLVLLVGEPGIGKTRLAEELAAEARRDGVTVLWGRCWEGEGAPPFWPWRQLLLSYVEQQAPLTLRAETGSGARDLLPLLPELGDRLPEFFGAGNGNRVGEKSAIGGEGETPSAVLSPQSSADPDAARFRLFQAVARLLRNAARTRPLLLLLDDLHWADAPSLLLLQFLSGELAESHLLIIGTYRDTDLDRRHPLAEALPSLRRGSHVERLLVRGLPLEDVERLLVLRAGHALDTAGTRLAAALHEETEGNPFFLGEVLRHLAESGKLVQQAGRWTVAVASIAELGIPEGVREVIGRRLSRLGEAANRVLSQASVLGREFELGLLAHLAEMDAEELEETLEEGIRAQLLTETPQRGTVRYAFSHALVRQTLYEELRLSRRQRLHLRAAEAMEALPPRPQVRQLGALAMHYREAGAAADPEKAIEYSVRAGEAAAVATAWEETIRHWQAAVELLAEQEGEDERRADLLVRLGDLIYATEWGTAQGREALEAALAIYAERGLARKAAEVHARLGRYLATYPGSQDLPQALVHLRAARPLLEADADSALLGYLYVGLALTSVFTLAEEPDGSQILERALAIGERLGDPDLQGQALCCLSIRTAYDGRVGEAMALLDRAWELTVGRCALVTSALIAGPAQVLCWWLRDHRVGRAWLERWLGQPATAAAVSLRTNFLSWLMRDYYALGELEVVRRLAEEASEGLSENLRLLALGDWAAARAVTEQGAEAARLRGDRLNQAGSLSWSAHSMRLEGDDAAAEAALRESLGLLDGERYPLLELQVRPPLALLLAETGRATEARAEVERCRTIAANGEDWRGLLGIIERAEAAVLAAEGDLASAEPGFERALAIFRQYGLLWDEAETHLLLGRFRAKAGERIEAGERFDAALAIYRRIGAGEPWIERVERLRAAANDGRDP